MRYCYSIIGVHGFIRGRQIYKQAFEYRGKLSTHGSIARGLNDGEIAGQLIFVTDPDVGSVS